ncbi:MAG: GNAT family N-acetyltransferase [Sphingobacteriaceae bacterium]|nr:MAG: GNAT family N-acetyltransferase [Sphingobacteriaceae bacterium]
MSYMYHIKQATTADVPTIRQLAYEIWPDTYAPILSADQIAYMLQEIYSIEKISEQINTCSQTYLLLLEDEQPVAFAAFSPREEDASIYKLHKLYCLTSTQGKGYGKALLNAVIERVLAEGKHRLELNVNRYNLAKSFYEKMGFTIAYEEDIPIGPYWMNDYVMRKEF